MICDPIKMFSGKHMSGKIQEMIGWKLYEAKILELPTIIQDKQLQRLKKAFEAKIEKQKKVKSEKDKASKAFYDRCAKLDLSYSDYNEEFSISYEVCPVPEKTHKDLQRATNLWTLGKKSDARDIWERIIAKYKLEELK